MSIVLLAFFILLTFFAGVFVMLGYILFRMMRNDGWDDSNITNALRLLSHVTLHSEDFAKMFYLPSDIALELESRGFKLKRPFWYVTKDEFEGVVKTRPSGE